METKNMADYRNYDLKSINNLRRLYSSNGRDKKAWSDLIMSLNESQLQSNINVITFFVQKLKEEPANGLTLDIIDFLVDYGPMSIIKEISSTSFMFNILTLIKNNNAGPLVQEKAIYLTKKWNDKYKKYPNKQFPGFSNNYSELKKRVLISLLLGFIV